MTILDKAKKETILGDGGYLFELEKRGYLKAGPFTPEAVLKFPDVVEGLHREFIRAGVDVLQTCTFYATKEKLKSSKNHRHMEAINRQAVRSASKVAIENKKKKVYVAGNLALTWQYIPESRKALKNTRMAIKEQIDLLMDEGVDFFIAETIEYLGEAEIALEEIQKTGLPSVITFSVKNAEKTKEGTDIVKACQTLSDKGVSFVGLNCARDPERILPVMEKIQNKVDSLTACQPVAYRCSEKVKFFQGQRYKGRVAFPLELDPFQLSRLDMANFAKRAQKMGINYIGGCCGAVACHIRSMAQALGKKGAAFACNPDLGVHPIIGQKAFVKEKDKKVLKYSR